MSVPNPCRTGSPGNKNQLAGHGLRPSNSGFTLVTFAIILPILLVLTLSILQLFIYFRAAGAVERAAGEAVRVLAVSEPTEGAAQQIQDVSNKSLVTSSHGGANGSISKAFNFQGQLYTPLGSNLTNSKHPPFKLSPTQNGPRPNERNPGVQLLPWVTAWTCQAPINEVSTSQKICGTNAEPSRYLGFLRYQLPTFLDFDGDSHEDICFFYPSTTADDWWVIPSSGGTIFRYSLQYDLGSSSSVSFRHTSLPCPADYDGDRKTDFCALVFLPSATQVQLRLSSELYESTRYFTLTSLGLHNAIPLPGKWTNSNQDSLALVITEPGSDESYLATWIWPVLQIQGKYDNPGYRVLLTDSPRQHNSGKYKPNPGRLWRPAFADHDGNSLLDIGWLSWSAANPTKIAVLPNNTATEAFDGIATDNAFEPWQLHYPSDSSSPGLYVSEHRNHRISLLTHGSDDVLNGDTSEQQILIAGVAGTTPATLTPNSPDPFAKGIGSLNQSPREGQSECEKCYPGGKYSGDGASAMRAHLNSPRGLAGGGTNPLFIADHGNARVRAVSTGADGVVNGQGNETIATVIGGVVPQGVTCPNLADGRSGPAPGSLAHSWGAYSTSAQNQGIHPFCVALEPLSLAHSAKENVLFIGDASSAIFALSPGADQSFNGDETERLVVFAGSYNESAKANPEREQLLGRIYGLSWLEDSGYPAGLFAILRLDDSANAGGLVAIIPNSNGLTTGTSRIVRPGRIVNISSRWGNPNIVRGSVADMSSTNLVNPSSVVARRSLNGTLNIFTAEWWNDDENKRYQQGLRHFYPTHEQASFSTYKSRWLNNSHNFAWGNRAPSSEAGQWYAQPETSHPLASVPIESIGGVALSPDLRYAYVSQTRQRSILRIALDRDADGLPDLATSEEDADPDLDGDGAPDSSDSNPYHLSVAATPAGAAKIRVIDQLHDPLVWAASPNRQMNTGKAMVDRIEWWLDRFAETSKVPDPSTGGIPAGEQGLYSLLGSNTALGLLPRGALNDSPIWPGGIHRNNELNNKTRLPRLAPVVMSSLAPTDTGLKHVSGYDHCTDWSADLAAPENSVSNLGEPSTACGRTLAKPLFADGRTVGIRRAHLGQWSNRWHPYTSNQAQQPLIGFLDWDGDSIRDPILYRTDLVPNNAARPLSIQIGRLTRIHRSNIDTPCPGSFAIGELSSLMPILSRSFSPALLRDQHQYSCGDSIAFFGAQPLVYASVLADAHAEWQVVNHIAGVSLAGSESQRLDFGKSQAGPVAETAYRVLEHLLKVERRDHAELPHDALVTLGDEDGGLTGTVTVSYVFKLNRFFAKFYGKDLITITRTARRRIHESERN